MAQARLHIGNRTVEVFGPRVEQLAHLLELDGSKKAKQLAERLGDHVADGEGREQKLDLDEQEQQKFLPVTDQLVAAAKDPADDLLELQGALKRARPAIQNPTKPTEMRITPYGETHDW